MKTLDPSVEAVRKMYGNRKPWDGWASFKHRLVRAGVIQSTAQDVPKAWQDAFTRACGR